MIKVDVEKSERVSQGDIFKEVDFIEYVVEKNGIIEVSKIRFPLIVVLSQDCDLFHDFKFRFEKEDIKTQDKLLLSVLVAPLYNVEHIYNGEHLSELNISMELISKNKTHGKDLRSNVKPRYHYLEFPSDIPIVSSVIDFKHYFSVNVDYLRELKKTNFVCKVFELYREDISHRFASFLSRIGLPELADKPLPEKLQE
jgi:hypothetical protein